MEPFNYFNPKALKLKFYKTTEKQHKLLYRDSAEVDLIYLQELWSKQGKMHSYIWKYIHEFYIQKYKVASFMKHRCQDKF